MIPKIIVRVNTLASERSNSGSPSRPVGGMFHQYLDSQISQSHGPRAGANFGSASNQNGSVRKLGANSMMKLTKVSAGAK